jgi:uncharacterized membrane protein YqjE
MHPLLHLLMKQPELLSEHAQAYAELAACEISDLAAALRRQALWSAAAVCCAIAALVLAGVALMLAALLPEARGAALWALLVAPGVPLLGLLVCVQALRVQTQSPAFSALRQQLRSDVQLFKEVTAP